MKKIIYLFAIIAFTLTSCEKNEIVKNEISQATHQKISNIVSVLNSNSSVAQSIKSAIVSQKQRIKSSDETPVLDEETQAAVNAFVENPQEALEQIAMGDKGAEQIDLLESIYMQDDQETILAKLKTFIPEDSIASIENAIAPSYISSFNFNLETNNSNNLIQKAKLDCGTDCKLHIMAGASAALGGATLVYIFSGFFALQVKAAAIVVAGLSAAVLFGAAKELYDSISGGGVEWRDFWNTVIGGVGGAVIAWGIATLIPSPIIAGVVTGVAAVIVGIQPLKELIAQVKRRS
jgi:uncharacterized protein YfiM (DUF2279 family)